MPAKKHSEKKKENHSALKPTSRDKKNNASLGMAFIIILLALGIANVLLMSGMPGKGSENNTQEPPKITATVITYSGCENCFNATAVLTAAEALDAEIEIKELDITHEDAKELAEKYEIKKLPTVIFSGELEKNSNIKAAFLSIGEEKEDGSILMTRVLPPYYDLDENKVKGLVSVTYINDSTCTNCYDVMQGVEQLESLGIVFANKEILEYSGASAQEIISKYSILSVPAIIFTEDISAYEVLNETLRVIGTFEDDGSYIIRSSRPPYRNLSTGNVDGIVGITYLVDPNCSECYNVSIHKTILTSNFGISIGSEATFETNTTEGSALIKKYNITAVPTVVLTSEAAAYPSLVQAWSQVGTIESDESLVFRNIEAMGTTIVYKNITQ